MPTHAEAVASLNSGMEDVNNRLTTMEEKHSAEMTHVITTMERLTKAVEALQLTAQTKPDHHAGKQPIFQNPPPPLLDSPPAATYGHSGVFNDPSSEHHAYTSGDMTQRPLRTPRMEVPIFNGDGVVGWLFQINRYFSIHNCNPDHMLESAPLFLAGDALLWFQWKSTTRQISTWEQLARDLKRRFGPSEYYDAELAINQLVQTSSAQAYITDFEKLSASAPRLVGHNLLTRFMAGLKSDIRHELVMLRPPDVETAMDMARVADDKLQALRRFTPRQPYTRPPSHHPSDQPRPTHTPLPIKRLTSTEMAARREKGLCFNCDDKFLPGHRCRPRFQCLLMEETADTEGFELVELDPSNNHEQPEPTTTQPHHDPAPCITFHALQGRTAPSTLRFHAVSYGQPMLVLVDSGSTHNFVQTRVARFLKLAIEPATHLSVTVGNGDEMKCEGVCREVPISINNTLFSVDLHLLPVFGADLVLGAQWLADVGPTTFCYRNMWMSLQRDGQTITLFGLKNQPQVTQSSASQIQKVANQQGALYFLQLFTTWSHDKPSTSSPSVPEITLPDQLEPEFLQSLTALLSTFKEVFLPPCGLPPVRATDHSIPLIAGTNPVNVRPYRYPHFQKTEIETMIQTMLKDGIIRPSRSPFSSPVLLVKKKDGSWRFCVDYRALNAITVKDKFPIPTVDELLDELHGATLFTKLDLRAGYHQLRMNETDVFKTVFRTHEGHYEFLVMPFGLTNAPASFQAEMNTIFKPFLRRCVLVFFDDILVYSTTPAEHLSHLREVLSTLSSHSFYAKPCKCDVARETLTYLGHVISRKGVAVDPEKILAIKHWPQPTNIKQLRGFLGLTGYYRRFVHHYASIAAPLTSLLRKDAYVWTTAATQAFNNLCTALSTTPVLTLPNFSIPFHVHTDASGTGVGAVLAQGGRPISYFSKQLSNRLQNSSAYNRELCALVWAVQKWRQYLLGQRFIVETDHQPLKTILSQTVHTPEQQHWVVKLLGYDFEVRYRPGKQNAAADALSRLHDSDTLAQPSCMVTLATSKPEFGILRALRHYYSTNSAGQAVIKSITDQPDSHTEWSIRDGLALFKGKLRVPNDTTLKELILYEFHNTTSSGHPGIQRTLARISANFHWEGLRQDVHLYVKRCDVCQQVKAPNSAPQGLLVPLPIPDKVWNDISMDFITHLPPSAGKTSIMVVVDRLSKYAHFSPLKGGCSAAEVANIFIRDIIRLHGFPSTIVSDRDPIFLSKFWKELFRQQGTLLAYSTAYHPQSDGQTEVVNRSLEDYLRCFVSDNQKDWVNFLPWAEYAYNTALHSATGHTPYEVVYGRQPPTLLDHITSHTSLPAVEDLVHKRTQLLHDLKGNLHRAQQRMQLQANAKRQDKSFTVGDFVWVRLQPYRQNTLRSRGTNKLARRFYGPFEISEQIGPVAYRLKLPASARVHDVFHIALLRRFVGDPSTITQRFPTQLEDLRPTLIPDTVLRTRKIQVPNGWKTQWLVKWQDHPDSEATWEFKDELQKDFPTFHHEDMVVSDGGGNVGNHQARARDGVHGEGTRDSPVVPRRGTRPREPSRRIPTNEFVLQS
ncbi:unnamed protein product [Rhodiola kirilowii]